MRVEVREISPVVREVEVELPQEMVQRELDRAYRDLGRRARVPGFRPGKVPRNILERRYGMEVNRQVASDLVSSSLGDALSEAEVEPVAEPAVQKEPVSRGNPYHYKLRCEVKPAIAPEGYLELEAERKAVEVADEEVAAELERLREQRAELRPVEGRTQVEAGDFVTLDYDAFVDGKPFEGSEARGRTLHLGGGSAIPGFEEALVGATVGEPRTFVLPLPEELQNKKIAGKEATFTGTVNEIKEKHVPELDDDLAQELSEAKTVDELRGQVREQLEARARGGAERELRDRLVDAILEKNEFEVPPALVEIELEQTLREAQMNLSMMGIDPSQLNLDPRKMRADMRPRAERRARQHLLLEAIADKEEVAVADEDLEARIRSFAESSGQALAKVRQTFSRPERRARLRAQIREEKVLDLLVARARIKDADSAEENADVGESTAKTDESK